MRSIALVLIVLTAACAAPELTDERRAVITQEIMDAANDFVVGLSTLDGDAFVARFSDAVISSTWTVVASTPTGRP